MERNSRNDGAFTIDTIPMTSELFLLVGNLPKYHSLKISHEATFLKMNNADPSSPAQSRRMGIGSAIS